MWPVSVRLGLLALFYVLFLVVGAAIFSSIEAPEEALRVTQLRRHRAEFLQKHTCVTGGLDSVTEMPCGEFKREQGFGPKVKYRQNEVLRNTGIELWGPAKKSNIDKTQLY
ncbi:hypothetical protein AAG570_008730 [Ranatra chinensis]|uniref:Uncharacterized protein n=1 Tax=Ranatra chinensis TaxID=642074 RepID=A0ABD0ZCW6_9HEMI